MTRISGFGEVELAAHQAKVSGRALGGHARAESLSPERRVEIAKQGAAARWVDGKPRSKYGARQVYLDRILFASNAEAKRYGELRLLEFGGFITRLVVHPAFPLEVDGKRIGTYRADFRYLTKGGEVVEDVKSPATAIKETFVRTKKHIAAQYGIEITVVLR